MSKWATKCPVCDMPTGKPVKTIINHKPTNNVGSFFKRLFGYCLFIMIGVPIACLILNFLGIYDTNLPSIPKPKTRIELIEGQFHPWDGSHIRLEQIIKDTMNDPDSYKHFETRYKDVGNYLIITTTFGGKNSFGGFVKNTISVKVSFNGNILQIIK